MMKFIAGFKPLNRSIHPFRFLPAFCTRQIAIISSKIIDIIANESADDNQILVEKLKTLTVKDIVKDAKDINISQKNLDQVKKLFTTGVTLDKCYRQKFGEIKHSKERIKNKERYTLQHTWITQASRTKKFIFYPTWITTTYVFDFIHKNIEQSILISDSEIPITTSFMLYSILMNKITKFASTLDQKTKKTLIQSNIIKKPQKFIYWRYQKLQMSNILDQCPEMYSDQKSSQAYRQLIGKSPSQLCYQIHNFYNQQKNIQIVVIIDQINRFAFAFRQLNQKIKSQESGQSPNIQEFQSKNYLKQQNENIQHIASIGRQVIYNSQTNIENQLLSKPINPRYESMILENHQKLYGKQLQFSSRTGNKKARDQGSYFIGPLYKRFYPQMTDAQIQQLKKDLLKNFDLTIPLMKNGQIIQYRYSQGIKPYYSQKKSYISLFINFEVLLYILIDLRIHNQQQLIFLINYLYVEIKILYNSNEQSQCYSFNIKRKKIFEEIKRFFPSMKFLKEVNNLMDIEIFRYSQKNMTFSNVIPLVYLVQYFRDKSYQLINNNIDYVMNNLLRGEVSRSAFGDFVERKFINGLQSCMLNQKKFYLNQSLRFNIQQRAEFYQFNPKPMNEQQKNEGQQVKKIKEVECYKDNMNMIMVKTRASNYPDFTILATPVYRNKYPSKSSFCVDLCLAKFSKQENKYYFIFIDIKTGSQPNYLKKNNDAKEFKRYLDVSLRSLKFEYVVQIYLLCPKDSFPRNQSDYKDIKFADIQLMKFEGASEKEQEAIKKYLELLAKII